MWPIGRVFSSNGVSCAVSQTIRAAAAELILRTHAPRTEISILPGASEVLNKHQKRQMSGNNWQNSRFPHTFVQVGGFLYSFFILLKTENHACGPCVTLVASPAASLLFSADEDVWLLREYHTSWCVCEDDSWVFKHATEWLNKPQWNEDGGRFLYLLPDIIFNTFSWGIGVCLSSLSNCAD